MKLPAARESITLIAQLGSLPDVVDLARADTDRWHEDLRADGLPEHVLTLVVTSADGASTAPVWGAALPADQARQLEHRLVRLTLDQELWPRLAADPEHG